MGFVRSGNDVSCRTGGVLLPGSVFASFHKEEHRHSCEDLNSSCGTGAVMDYLLGGYQVSQKLLPE